MSVLFQCEMLRVACGGLSCHDVFMNMFAEESLRTAEVEEHRRVAVDHERHLGCFLLVLVFSCACYFFEPHANFMKYPSHLSQSELLRW